MHGRLEIGRHGKRTASENQEYAQFRQQYQALWRQFFDPVGVRFALHDRQVRIETYILPMIQINEYQLLRTWTSGGTTPVTPAGSRRSRWPSFGCISRQC
jgi:hypothetical protein